MPLFPPRSERNWPLLSKLRFVGLDVHAETIAVAAAETGGEVRSSGVMKISRKLRRQLFEACPANLKRRIGFWSDGVHDPACQVKQLPRWACRDPRDQMGPIQISEITPHSGDFAAASHRRVVRKPLKRIGSSGQTKGNPDLWVTPLMPSTG